eukprot:3006605-Prymnesium_polylepis.1
MIGSTVIFFDGFFPVEKLRARRMQLNAWHKNLSTLMEPSSRMGPYERHEATRCGLSLTHRQQ